MMKDTLKAMALKALVPLSAFWLRQGIVPIGKRWVWDRICAPHLIWRDWDLTARAKAGFRIHAKPREFQEGRILFFGVWEPTITAWFQRLLRPGDVVLDVGANLGYFTLLSSRLVGSTGHVFAVEPGRRNRERLTGNLQLNGARNVTVLPYGAWDAADRAVLRTKKGGSGTATLGVVEHSVREEACELVRLDEVVPREYWPRVKLIKIDVEGAEYRALHGLLPILHAAPAASIICEVNPDGEAQFGNSPAELCELLADMGFTIYTLHNDIAPLSYIEQREVPRMPLKSVPDRPVYLYFERPATATASKVSGLSRHRGRVD